MKRSLFILLTLSCCAWFASCHCETNGYEADTSLAGSISMKNYRMDARITYDGKEVVVPGDEPLFMTVGKKSDHMVSMYCGTKPGLDITMGMSIPEVSLS